MFDQVIASGGEKWSESGEGGGCRAWDTHGSFFISSIPCRSVTFRMV